MAMQPYKCRVWTANALLLALSAFPTLAADAVVAGAVRVDATFLHLGLVWEISGDDDRDSAFTLEFRKTGTSAWLPAAPAMGAVPSMIVDGSPLGLHTWAASALFLEAETQYELRATLDDPDGGGEVRIVSGMTRARLNPSPSGRQLFVEPGSSGGDGSKGDPFLGLQSAADAALPGDTFHVAPGDYDAFQISTSGTLAEPISFLGPPFQLNTAGGAIVDGAGTDRGVVTVGTDSSTPISWILIEGLTIQNGKWGIDAQHTSEIAIQHNTIRDVDFGVYNRRDADLERNQTVCDNVITGRTSWPSTGIPSERGIDLRGYGNVVCHNLVSDFGDCVSVQPNSGESFGNDVFGNDITRCVDDGIEIDYNRANVRVWRNRVYNTRMGVSVQPIRGGPAYIFRNELFNQEDKPLKVHNDPTGLVVAHNTSVKRGDAMHDTSSSVWRNALFRNNLFLGLEYAFEFTTTPTDGFRDFDHNAWGTTRAGTSGEPWFKWDNIRYDDMVALRSATGQELNGIEAEFGDLVNADLPPSWDVEVAPTVRDLSLNGAVPELDIGAALPNLNSGFSLIGPPDLGAFERGLPVPSYGPRLPGLVFEDGFESGDMTGWSQSARQTFPSGRPSPQSMSN